MAEVQVTICVNYTGPTGSAEMVERTDYLPFVPIAGDHVVLTAGDEDWSEWTEAVTWRIVRRLDPPELHVRPASVDLDGLRRLLAAGFTDV